MLLQNQGFQTFPELTSAVVGNFPCPYPAGLVLLCCEILSREDRLGAMLAKCVEYRTWGVRRGSIIPLRTGA